MHATFDMCCVHGHAWWPAGAEHIEKKSRRKGSNKQALLSVTVNSAEAKLAAPRQLQGSTSAEPNLAPAPSAAEPAAEPAADLAAEPAAEPADSMAEPAADLAAVPAAEPAADLATEPAVEPAADMAAEPAAKPADSIQAAGPSIQAAGPAAEPAAEPAAQALLSVAGDAAAKNAEADALLSSREAKKMKDKQQRDEALAASPHAEPVAVPQTPWVPLSSKVRPSRSTLVQYSLVRI